MLLQSKNGNLFELSIVGYQFVCRIWGPTGDFDANWLNVRIRATDAMGSWTKVDPCLETGNLPLLSGWLLSIGTGVLDPPWNPLEFVEPNISFELGSLTDGGPVLRVRFELECRPPWSQADTVSENPYIIEFPLSDLDLKAAVDCLVEEQRRFPPR